MLKFDASFTSSFKFDVPISLFRWESLLSLYVGFCFVIFTALSFEKTVGGYTTEGRNRDKWPPPRLLSVGCRPLAVAPRNTGCKISAASPLFHCGLERTECVNFTAETTFSFSDVPCFVIADFPFVFIFRFFFRFCFIVYVCVGVRFYFTSTFLIS